MSNSKMNIELEVQLLASPETIYKAWLNSKVHSAMTGSKAVCSARLHGKFSAWDGYIFGTNRELIPHSKIVQTWRTTDFADTDQDSELTLLLSPFGESCILKLHHRKIPSGQPDYEEGWINYYFSPMQNYFK